MLLQVLILRTELETGAETLPGPHVSITLPDSLDVDHGHDDGEEDDGGGDSSQDHKQRRRHGVQEDRLGWIRLLA